MQNLFLPIKDIEKMSIDDKRKYFSNLQAQCLNIKKGSKNIAHEIITKIYPMLRNYEYENPIGLENIPDNGRALFVCNHSNSHDFFTAHETFKKIGTNVSVFAASDDLDMATNQVFKLCDAVLVDRNNKESINNGILQFANNLRYIPGVIFGESTWNLHPFKPMQPIKVGSVNISAIAEVPIIPTIFEYCEIPKLCQKEKELYTKCIIKFGRPIYPNRDESLIFQTTKLQKIMEQNRLELWKKLGIAKYSLNDVNREIYLNHTYLKKFDAFGFTYDSESEAKFLFSKNGLKVENEFHIDVNGNFVPGITEREAKRIRKK